MFTRWFIYETSLAVRLNNEMQLHLLYNTFETKQLMKNEAHGLSQIRVDILCMENIASSQRNLWLVIHTTRRIALQSTSIPYSVAV